MSGDIIRTCFGRGHVPEDALSREPLHDVYGYRSATRGNENSQGDGGVLQTESLHEKTPHGEKLHDETQPYDGSGHEA